MFGSQNAPLSSPPLDFSHFSVPTLRLPALSALDFKHSNPRTFLLINRSFRTSPHQYHSMVLTLPLFSYSYALFCSEENAIFILFSIFRTLWQKHPGWGYIFKPRVCPVLLSTPSLLDLALTKKSRGRGSIVPPGWGGTANAFP
jgi:hypothetical protein